MPDSLDQLDLKSLPSSSPYAAMVQEIEGWHPGSTSQVNNNPGNLKYAKQAGATGADEKGFAKFPDYKTGLDALNKQIQLDASRGLTIQQFADKYAPASDHNDPKGYAARLAAATGHDVNSRLSGDSLDSLGPQDSLDKLNVGKAGYGVHPSGTPVVAPSTSFEYLGNVLHRGVDGALRGVGLPDTSDPAWQNPIRAKDILPALNPWNLVKGLGQAGSEQLQKTAQSARQMTTADGLSNKVGAAGEMLGHAAAAAFPPLAPAANAPDVAKTGDVFGALMQSGANLGSVFGGGKAATPGEAAAGMDKYPLAPKPLTPEEANFQTSAKHLTEAVKPGPQTPKFQDSLRTVLPEYKALEPVVGPITTKNRAIAGQLAEAKYKQNFQNYLEPAVDRNTQVDGNAIADEKMDAIPSSLRPDPADDPSNPFVQSKNAQYAKLKDEADSFRRPFDLPTLYDRLQENNAEAQQFHNMNGDQKYAAQLAGRPQAQVNAEGVGFRKALYNAIDPYTNGSNIAESQGRYSDLIHFRQQMDRLDNNIAQQPTPSATQKYATAASDAFGLVTGQGAQMIKRRALEPDALATKVAKGFKNYEGDPLPQIPAPPSSITPPSVPKSTDMTLTSPSGRAQFTVQRDLFGPEHPAYTEGSEVGSKPNFELTRPDRADFETQRTLNLNGPFPNSFGGPGLKLTPTDPKTFDWQRALFPEMPERPVEPPPVNP